MATIEKANKASEQMSKATNDYFKSAMDHAGSLRERNTKFTRTMFESGTREMRQQAESNRALAQDLVARTEQQREAFQTLVEESVDAYMDLVFAPLAYYKQGLKLVENEVTEGGFPIRNYDDLNVEEVGKEFDNLSAQELREVRQYEKSNKSRETVISQIDRKLKPAS